MNNIFTHTHSLRSSDCRHSAAATFKCVTYVVSHCCTVALCVTAKRTKRMLSPDSTPIHPLSHCRMSSTQFFIIRFWIKSHCGKYGENRSTNARHRKPEQSTFSWGWCWVCWVWTWCLFAVAFSFLQLQLKQTQVMHVSETHTNFQPSLQFVNQIDLLQEAIQKGKGLEVLPSPRNNDETKQTQSPDQPTNDWSSWPTNGRFISTHHSFEWGSMVGTTCNGTEMQQIEN